MQAYPQGCLQPPPLNILIFKVQFQIEIAPPSLKKKSFKSQRGLCSSLQVNEDLFSGKVTHYLLLKNLTGRNWHNYWFQFTPLCPTLCDPMYCSTPGLPVHHQLLELAQIYVHQVSDAIQPSHPWLSPSPPALSFPRFIPRT